MASRRSLGKYHIIAELGHGGMADILLALVGGFSGSGFAKLAVLKKVRQNLAEDPEFIAMLVDEARITARLNHPNVVQTLEVGVEGNEYYLAMEYLDGQPLHRLQRRAQRTGPGMSCELQYLVVADALAGLHHAHELADYDGTPLRVVHRDVTPQNIFVTYDGQVKVVDFGIAKAAGRAAETRAGIVKGKVRYMSPEQAMGAEIDRRSDVFAAGLMIWEAATGRRFWQDLGDLEIVEALLAGDYQPSPRAVDPTVPEAIDRMCVRALARSPEDRYATAAELRADLEAFLGDDVVKARRELGPLVAGLFAKERRELRDIIEQVSRTAMQPASMAAISQRNNVLSVSAPSSLSSSTNSRPSLTPSTSPIVVAKPSVAKLKHEVDAAEVSLLGFIPRKKRFGVGAAVGALMMLASFLVALASLQFMGYGSASGAVGSRVGAQLVHTRRPLRVASTPSRRVVVSAEPVAASFPLAPAMAAAAAPAPPPPPPIIIAAPHPATTAPAPARQTARRHSIDTTDPWAPN